jgi:hypothetical protein
MINGINYDTGFFVGEDSRPDFDEATAAREMRIIADDLHCDAVRISGGDPSRIEAASVHAAKVGLQVWFAPFPVDLDQAAMVEVVRDSASRAERLRASGADVVLVTGCEISLFGRGLIAGATLPDRITTLIAGGPDLRTTQQLTQQCLNDMLEVARSTFGGPISYASGIWEDVDWSGFDVVGIDGYRDEQNAPYYRQLLALGHRHGKPVVVTEFGCCTYRGAGARGGMGWMVGDPTADPPLDGTLQRDEQEQVDYFTQSMQAFVDAGVHGAFWFTFGLYTTVRRPDDPTRDTDLASYGVVAMLDGGRHGTRYPSMSWEPKMVFDAMAMRYGQQESRLSAPAARTTVYRE